MYWLVLIFTFVNSPSMVVIPEKYLDLAQCQNAGMKAEVRHICVRASETSNTVLAPNLPQYDKDGNLKVAPYPGYYCGNNGCYIDNMPKCYAGPNGNLDCKAN